MTLPALAQPLVSEASIALGRQGRFAMIDLLRIAAALCVVMHHWNWVVPDDLRRMAAYPEAWAQNGGFFGVSLFFMISGFVILRSASGTTAGNFLVHRAVRLYPAFLICCTATWLVRVTSTTPAPTALEYFANLSMFPGLFGVRAVDGVYWTLAFEARFYLLIALLIALRALKYVEPVLWVWLLIAQLVVETPHRQLVMADYAPFFVGGCACCLLADRFSRGRLALFLAALIAGVAEAMTQAGIVAQLFKLAPGPAWAAVVVGLFFPLMLALALRLIDIRPSRLLWTAGAISYPLYLLHAEIGYRLFAGMRSAPGIAIYGALLAMVLALAWLIATRIEPPVQAWLRGRLAPRTGKCP